MNEVNNRSSGRKGENHAEMEQSVKEKNRKCIPLGQPFSKKRYYTKSTSEKEALRKQKLADLEYEAYIRRKFRK